MYVGPHPVARPQDLLPRRTERLPEVFPLVHPTTILSDGGRSALAAVIRSWSLGAGHTVLVPSYICPSALTPFRAAGVKLAFYPLTRNLTPDLGWLDANMEGKSALLVVHYFGFPQPLEGLQRTCVRRKVGLIEDCAHAFLSSSERGPLGSFGDASVFSFRKSLPVPDGGAAVLAEGANGSNGASGPALRSVSRRRVARETGKLLIAWAENIAHFSPRMFLLRSSNLRRAVMERDANRKVDLRGLSAVGRASLARLDAGGVIEERRANFLFYLERSAALRPLFERLPGGVCPLGFPVRVRRRDAVRTALLRRGFNLRSYWDVLPDEVTDRSCLNSRELAREILVLPVYQGLATAKRESVLRALAAVSQEET